MMKKQLSVCALLFAFSGATFAGDIKPTNKADDPFTVLETLDEKKTQGYLANALTFSGETVPFEDDEVYFKFIRNLNARVSYAFVEQLQTIAEVWFPIIEPILAEYGIPNDFKYIPAIESGFTKNARSHAGAVGYWQFMPATARGYGLSVGRKVDDRKDIYKSTVAACRYLSDLYERLGSWTLVAAAYNVGGGALSSAMNRQNEDDYFDLKLNKETGNYVYKLLVFKHVFEHAMSVDPFFTESSTRISNMKQASSLGLLSLGLMAGMGGMKLPQSSAQPIQAKTTTGKKKLFGNAGKLFDWM